jgi:hypothetical protein
MTEGKDKHEQDEAQALDETELTKDLEIKDAEDADAVKGGQKIIVQKIT